MTPSNPAKGFTLIELLIVVAIIAILAAIAVPNFLEAQTRSKVSRVRSDLRTMATAVETYAVDWGKHPVDYVLEPLTAPGYGNLTAESFFPSRLSTPVAYVTNARPGDVFVRAGAVANIGGVEAYLTLFYQNCITSLAVVEGNIAAEYIRQIPKVDVRSIKAAGGWSPFFVQAYGAWKMGSVGPDRDYNGGANIYDATNGTMSSGDIYRTQRLNEGGGV